MAVSWFLAVPAVQVLVERVQPRDGARVPPPPDSGRV